MTFNEDPSSYICSTKEKEIALFEDFLYQEFKDLEKDYEGVDRVMNKFKNKLKLEQETNGTTTKGNR